MSETSSTPTSHPPSPRAFTPSVPSEVSDCRSSSTSIDVDPPPYLPPISTGVPLDFREVTKPPGRPSSVRTTSARSWRKLRLSKSTSRQDSIPEEDLKSSKKASPMAAALSLFAYLRIPIAATGALVAGISGLLYWKQNELIYPRHVPPGSRTEVPKPLDFPEYASMGEQSDSNWEELYVPTPDGETLHGFLLRSSNRQRQGRQITVMMFHGNAGNIGHRLPVAGVLDMHAGCNVIMIEYRGYGLSTGVPDEKGLNIDSQTALEWFRTREDLRNTKLVVYGQSLGGAVAIQLAARNREKDDIAALILENTFLNIRKLIPQSVQPRVSLICPDVTDTCDSAFPPAKYIAHLCHQIWPSEATLPSIDVPVLFLSGLQDEIIPASHMARLHHICRSKHKIIRTFANGQHNNTVAAPGYFEIMTQFIQEYVVDPSPRM